VHAIEGMISRFGDGTTMLLRCEGLEPPMSHLGHSHRSDGQQGFADVRYAFNGERLCASQRTDANGMDRPCSRPEPLRG